MPTDTSPVVLTIEYVMLGNDRMDEAGWDVGALAAVCWQPGEHQGIHFLVPVTNDPADEAAANAALIDMIEGSAFPYKIEAATCA